ncbi:hypothetical protein [Hyphomonas sp.]|uniref:hypothetical protein n=1 Tax=Hyphomonas sp. TaxID=87 RepID=UPI0025BCDCDF|nr:hypothetical protein [Hyphomonas sp.]MBI1400130.1 hypothetical protein [Hyphomonas sp.]
MRLRLEHVAEPPRTPVSRFVHRPLDGPFHTASQFEPPFPAPVAGKGYPLWTLEHRGHELNFASPEEMAHVAEVMGQRVLPKPRVLGAEQSAVNSHWLSRMDKAWLSWKVRQEIVRKLTEAFA